MIALAGRALSDDPDEPKYINSPETAFYKKSEVLYGFFQAKGSIRKAERVIVVEGYMDCIRLHQEGVGEVVAVSGTALSEVQVGLIRRQARRVYLAFDADEAGQLGGGAKLRAGSDGRLYRICGTVWGGEGPG